MRLGLRGMLVTCSCCALLLLPCAASASSPPAVFGPAATFTALPSDAQTASSDTSALYGVSCTAVGNCLAGGMYDRASSPQAAFVTPEVNGTWQTGTALDMSGLAGGVIESRVYSVSCPAPGSCAAGGFYVTASKGQPAFVASENAGTFAPALEIALPGNAASGTNTVAQVSSVACTAAGNCIAGGEYHTASNSEIGFVATETGGFWGGAVPITPPTDLNPTYPSDPVNAVACTSQGNCTAAGYYLASGPSEEPYVATETNGTWSAGTKLALPQGALHGLPGQAQASSVACTSQGNCVAGGSYSDSKLDQLPMVATETNGSWGPAVTVSAPSGTTLEQAPLSTISCAGAGSCVAGGTFSPGAGGSNLPLTASSGANGMWEAARPLALPQGAAAESTQNAQVYAVSCPAPGFCTAVGAYKSATHGALPMTATSAPQLGFVETPVSTAVGARIRIQLAGTGGTGHYQWSAQGLPAGLSLDAAAGVIAGAVSHPGVFDVGVSMVDPGPPSQQASGTLMLTVAAPPRLGYLYADAIGSRVLFTARCLGATYETCVASVQVVVREHVRGRKLIAIGARGHTVRVRTIVVAGAAVRIGGGGFVKQKLKLNGTGRQLIHARHKLTAKVVLIPAAGQGKRTAFATVHLAGR